MRASPKLKTVKPSSSYEIMLPSEIREQYEGKISTFWLNGNPVALQLSSYIREEVGQVSALDRLNERIANDPRRWRRSEHSFHLVEGVDEASAEFTDENDCIWIHSYLVWPHLTVYATVSGPRLHLEDKTNWAFQSMKNIQLVLH